MLLPAKAGRLISVLDAVISAVRGLKNKNNDAVYQAIIILSNEKEAQYLFKYLIHVYASQGSEIKANTSLPTSHTFERFRNETLDVLIAPESSTNLKSVPANVAIVGVTHSIISPLMIAEIMELFSNQSLQDKKKCIQDGYLIAAASRSTDDESLRSWLSFKRGNHYTVDRQSDELPIIPDGLMSPTAVWSDPIDSGIGIASLGVEQIKIEAESSLLDLFDNGEDE